MILLRQSVMLDDAGQSVLPSPLICARHLNKSFNSSGVSIDILKSADFELKPGETVAVTGASGIGKSTFLHILGTLDRPDTGTLLFKGKDVFGFDDTRLAKFRNESVGFVFQFHHLLSEFSAIENVMIPALINGQSKKEGKEIAEAILVRVGLEERLSHMAGRLSGGEQQRVAIARALVLNPPLLLADELTGNLDQKNSDHIHMLLLELNKELGMSLVLVTHNAELASYMSRSLTIVDGKIV